jgi:carbon starvation protein CstA
VAANTGYLGGPIPIALLMGIYNQFIRPGHIGEMSLIGCSGFHCDFPSASCFC